MGSRAGGIGVGADTDVDVDGNVEPEVDLDVDPSGCVVVANNEGGSTGVGVSPRRGTCSRRLRQLSWNQSCTISQHYPSRYQCMAGLFILIA
jgi:hypothetical protein